MLKVTFCAGPEVCITNWSLLPITSSVECVVPWPPRPHIITDFFGFFKLGELLPTNYFSTNSTLSSGVTMTARQCLECVRYFFKRLSVNNLTIKWTLSWVASPWSCVRYCSPALGQDRVYLMESKSKTLSEIKCIGITTIWR